MNFRELDIKGVFLVTPEPARDRRGFFARTWCREEFAEHGIDDAFDQASVSYNHKRGTLRGIHYQAPPHGESKLVRCTRGSLFDVAVDLRPASPSYGRWVGEILSEVNHAALVIPEGCAHGFQTLEDETEVFYQIAGPYRPEASRGIRWNDPQLAVDWPLAGPILSERDADLPTLDALPAPAEADLPVTAEAS